MRAVLVAGLVVLAACGDPTVTVTVTELDGSHGIFVAYQAGDGAWRAVEGDGTYRFEVAEGRYGVAVWCAATLYRHVAFDYLTTGELTEVEITGGCPVVDMTIRGAVRNAASTAQVSWSANAAIANAAGGYVLRGAKGTHDLIAADTDDLVILRDEEITADRTINLDLASADAVALETHDVTLDGAADGDFAVVSSVLYSAGGTAAALGTATGTDLTFSAVPADAMIDGDRQAVSVQATGPAVAGEPQRSRGVVSYAGGDLAVTLLAPTDPPSVSDGPTFAWTTFEGAQSYALTVRQTDAGGAEHDLGGAWSPGYLGADVTLAPPDLSGVEGWDARVDLVAGRAIFWSVSARTSNVSLGRALAAPEAGTELSTTGWYGSLDP